MPAAVLLCLRTSVVRTTLPCRGVGEDRAKIREAGMGSVKSASSRSRRASPSRSKSSTSNRSNDCPQTVPHDARGPGRLFLAGPIHCVQPSISHCPARRLVEQGVCPVVLRDPGGFPCKPTLCLDSESHANLPIHRRRKSFACGWNSMPSSRGNIGRAQRVWPRLFRFALVAPGASTLTSRAAQAL